MSEDKKVTKKASPKKEAAKKTVVKKTAVKKAPVKKVVEKKEKVVAEKKKVTSDKKKLSSKYIQAIGRRKTAVAQVRLYFPGKGDMTINNKEASDLLLDDNLNIVLQPLKACSKLDSFDFTVITKGGGTASQIEAIRHGVARALLKYDPELKTTLKVNGYLTRDPRKKERKKPGLKKARKAPQWSKR
jgi:small subunit ribosomal protein S9